MKMQIFLGVGLLLLLLKCIFGTPISKNENSLLSDFEKEIEKIVEDYKTSKAELNDIFAINRDADIRSAIANGEKQCSSSGDCRGKKNICNDGYCVECQTDSDCVAKHKDRRDCYQHQCIEDITQIDAIDCDKHPSHYNCKTAPGSDIYVPEFGKNDKRAVIKESLWPDGKVYYTFDDDVTETNRGLVKDALDEMEKNTCLNFTRVDKDNPSEKYYILVQAKDAGCGSYPGRASILIQPQIMNLMSSDKGTCMNKYTIQHEFMHAIGIYHEQSRKDRDRYVYIHWDRIKQKQWHNFDIKDTLTLGLPYKTNSVMHYPPTAFSKDDKSETITLSDGFSTYDARHKVTTRDYATINALYCKTCSNQCKADEHKECKLIHPKGFWRSIFDDTRVASCECIDGYEKLNEKCFLKCSDDSDCTADVTCLDGKCARLEDFCFKPCALYNGQCNKDNGECACAAGFSKDVFGYCAQGDCSVCTATEECAANNEGKAICYCKTGYSHINGKCVKADGGIVQFKGKELKDLISNNAAIISYQITPTTKRETVAEKYHFCARAVLYINKEANMVSSTISGYQTSADGEVNTNATSNNVFKTYGYNGDTGNLIEKREIITDFKNVQSVSDISSLSVVLEWGPTTSERKVNVSEFSFSPNAIVNNCLGVFEHVSFD